MQLLCCKRGARVYSCSAKGLAAIWLQCKTPGTHLLIGVASDALVFHHATLVSTDSAGRNFEIVIPFGAPVNLVVNGGFFLLSNVLGQPLTRTASTLIR